MRVEVKDGISLDVNTMAELRFLLVWSSSLAVVVPDDRDRRESVKAVCLDMPLEATRLNLLLAFLVWELTSGLRIVRA